jgi:hypothetical protein
MMMDGGRLPRRGNDLKRGGADFGHIKENRIRRFSRDVRIPKDSRMICRIVLRKQERNSTLEQLSYF